MKLTIPFLIIFLFAFCKERFGSSRRYAGTSNTVEEVYRLHLKPATGDVKNKDELKRTIAEFVNESGYAWKICAKNERW